jgi:hypothetical protein
MKYPPMPPEIIDDQRARAMAVIAAWLRRDKEGFDGLLGDDEEAAEILPVVIGELVTGLDRLVGRAEVEAQVHGWLDERAARFGGLRLRLEVPPPQIDSCLGLLVCVDHSSQPPESHRICDSREGGVPQQVTHDSVCGVDALGDNARHGKPGVSTCLEAFLARCVSRKHEPVVLFDQLPRHFREHRGRAQAPASRG